MWVSADLSCIYLNCSIINKNSRVRYWTKNLIDQESGGGMNSRPSRHASQMGEPVNLSKPLAPPSWSSKISMANCCQLVADSGP